MKLTKIRRQTVFVAILCILFLLLFTASGCEEIKEITGIRLNCTAEGATFEMGAFDYGAYSVTVLYADGTSRDMPLTEEMISEEDQINFFSEGQYTVEVTYAGFTDTFDVSFTRKSFADNITLNGYTVGYDGKAHEIKVEGDVPAGTTVTYPNGNSFTQVGKHTVTAVLSRENYITKELTSEVEITLGTYDLSAYLLADTSFVYDGEAKEIKAQGSLPAGVKATYQLYKCIDETHATLLQRLTATEAGEYYYAVSFSSENPNYFPIPDRTVKMTISHAVYDMSNVSFSNVTLPYDGKPHSLAISGTLPKGVKVSYSLAPQTDAGVYTCVATFTGNSDNYAPIAPKTATLTISPIAVNVGKFYLDPVDNYVFDGAAHCPTVSTLVDLEKEEMEIEYVIRRGKNVTAGTDVVSSAVNAGDYTVEAKFTYKNGSKNYEPIPSLYQTFTIEKQLLSIDTLTFDTLQFSYDGQPHTPTFDAAALAEKKLTATYTVLKEVTVPGQSAAAGVQETTAVSAGNYQVIAVFSVLLAPGESEEDAANYQVCDSVGAEFTIDRISYGVTPYFDESNATLVYDPEDLPLVRLANNVELQEKGILPYYVYRSGYARTGAALEGMPQNAGTYTVEAKFNYTDTVNYLPLSSVYFTFEILPKPITFEFDHSSTSMVYTGNPQSPLFALSVKGELSMPVLNYGYVDEVHYRAGKNATSGVMINEPTEAGHYTMEIVLTGGHPNYQATTTVFYITYEITPIVVDLTAYTVAARDSHNYTVPFSVKPQKPMPGVDVATDVPYLDKLTIVETAEYWKRSDTGTVLYEISETTSYIAHYYFFPEDYNNYVFKNGVSDMWLTFDIPKESITLSETALTWTEKVASVSYDANLGEWVMQGLPMPTPTDIEKLQRIFSSVSIYAFGGHDVTSGLALNGAFMTPGNYTVCVELRDYCTKLDVSEHALEMDTLKSYSGVKIKRSSYPPYTDVYFLYFNVTIDIYELDLSAVTPSWYVTGTPGGGTVKPPTPKNLPSDVLDFFDIEVDVKAGLNAMKSAPSVTMSSVGQYTVFYTFASKQPGIKVKSFVGLSATPNGDGTYDYYYSFNVAVVDIGKYAAALIDGTIYDSSHITLEDKTYTRCSDSETYTLPAKWDGVETPLPECFKVEYVYHQDPEGGATPDYYSPFGIEGYEEGVFLVEVKITTINPAFSSQNKVLSAYLTLQPY